MAAHARTGTIKYSGDAVLYLFAAGLYDTHRGFDLQETRYGRSQVVSDLETPRQI